MHDIKLKTVTEDPDTGAVEIIYEWNGQEDVATFANMAQLVSEYSNPLTSSLDAKRHLFNLWMALDPTGTNPSVLLGKTVEVDYAASPQLTILP